MAEAKTGTWVPIFWAMIVCDVIAAFMALWWLKPVAVRPIARAQESFEAKAATPATG